MNRFFFTDLLIQLKQSLPLHGPPGRRAAVLGETSHSPDHRSMPLGVGREEREKDALPPALGLPGGRQLDPLHRTPGLTQIGCAEISLKGGFILLIATQIGYHALTQDHPQSDDSTGFHGPRPRAVPGVAVHQSELPDRPADSACLQTRRWICSM